MPSVAAPVAIMLGAGASAGAIAHWNLRGFWKASVVGGIVGMLLWTLGATLLVGLTEGIGPLGMDALYLLLKSMAITCAVTLPAAVVAGLVVRRVFPAPPKTVN